MRGTVPLTSEAIRGCVEPGVTFGFQLEAVTAVLIKVMLKVDGVVVSQGGEAAVLDELVSLVAGWIFLLLRLINSKCP